MEFEEVRHQEQETPVLRHPPDVDRLSSGCLSKGGGAGGGEKTVAVAVAVAVEGGIQGNNRWRPRCNQCSAQVRSTLAGQVRVTRPDPYECENLLTRPDP